MRCISRVVTLGIMMALCAVGCAAEQNLGAEAEPWVTVEPEQIAQVEIPEELTDKGIPGPGESSVLAGCSFVEWCDAPGADGARCKQQGCGEWEAIGECVNEVADFCGRAVCPVIFVALNGARSRLVSNRFPHCGW